jgi:hypothetical protein
VRLPHPHHPAEFGLRQIVLGPVADHLDGDVVGQLRAFVLTPALRVAHVLLVHLTGGLQS